MGTISRIVSQLCIVGLRMLLLPYVRVKFVLQLKIMPTQGMYKHIGKMRKSNYEYFEALVLNPFG